MVEISGSKEFETRRLSYWQDNLSVMRTVSSDLVLESDHGDMMMHLIAIQRLLRRKVAISKLKDGV